MDRDKLVKKLKRLIKPSVDLKDTSHAITYYPCGVKLIDNKTIECICFVDHEVYNRHWADTFDDRPFLFIDIADIQDIFESKYRLPAELAQKIYDNGEAGMGYFLFRVVMKNGKRFTYATGDLVDFIEPPLNYSIKDIVDVTIDGDFSDYYQKKEYLSEKDYYWCLINDL